MESSCVGFVGVHKRMANCQLELITCDPYRWLNELSGDTANVVVRPRIAHPDSRSRLENLGRDGLLAGIYCLNDA